MHQFTDSKRIKSQSLEIKTKKCTLWGFSLCSTSTDELNIFGILLQSSGESIYTYMRLDTVTPQATVGLSSRETACLTADPQCKIWGKRVLAL